MASEDEEKTLPPSQRKLDQARERGEAFAAPEVRHAVMMGAILLGLSLAGGKLVSELARTGVRIFVEAGRTEIGPEGAQQQLGRLMGDVGAAILPLLALLFAGAVLTAPAQGGLIFSTARLAPKWSRISPVAGFKRMFGMQGLANLGKTLAKMGMVLGLAVFVLYDKIAGIDDSIGRSPGAVGTAAARLTMELLQAVTMAVAVLAALDFFVQRRSWLKRLGMSRQELKEEMRESDGDPMVKGRMRALGMRRARQRMMAAVPAASVVITNPTHYAVALRYEHGQMSAPVVVAKGTDAVALKIREVAREHDIPIVESPPLARALHASVEIDRPIPVQHYTAVAEIISYVMRLAGEARR